MATWERSFGRIAVAAFTTCVVHGFVAMAPAMAAVVNILPVKICDDAGDNCANDVGELYLDETNKIWAQAGIVFNYLAFETLNATEFLSFEDQDEVDSFFNAAPGGALDPLTITMWFTNSIFDAFGEANAIGGNKILIDTVVFTDNRFDTLAHELGHTLGLRHDDPGMDATFLMTTGSERTIPGSINDITPDGLGLDRLTAAQIRTANADPKVIAPIPLPAAYILLTGGLASLAVVSRRRRAASAC